MNTFLIKGYFKNSVNDPYKISGNNVVAKGTELL